jgi:hypothetical protein
MRRDGALDDAGQRWCQADPVLMQGQREGKVVIHSTMQCKSYPLIQASNHSHFYLPPRQSLIARHRPSLPPSTVSSFSHRSAAQHLAALKRARPAAVGAVNNATTIHGDARGCLPIQITPPSRLAHGNQLHALGEVLRSVAGTNTATA